MSHNILIVEDNADIAGLIKLHAKDIHCESDIASDGKQALQMFKQGDYQLVILDLMLPEINGIEVCRQLRAIDYYVPILMLTSKSSEIDRVIGLEVGADDYITKPFSIPELMARIKVQFRRSDALLSNAEALSNNKSNDVSGDMSNVVSSGLSNDTSSTMEFGELIIDPSRHLVSIANEEISLTAKEFELLHHFASNPGLVFSRQQLLEQVWGYNYEGYEHTVNSHINRLRAKIEIDPTMPSYILTVWGVGYRFLDK